MRFHLDERVDTAIAEALRQRGIGVSTTQSASAPDEAHVAFCLAERRVLFTNDADLLRLAQSGHEHFGIAYCAPQTRSLGYIVRYFCLMHDCLEEDQVRGTIEFL